MEKYNMGKKLIETVKELYAKATSVVVVHGAVGEWFHTSVVVYEGCFLSPTLFNIFLKCTMTNALEDYSNTVSTGRQGVTNL